MKNTTIKNLITPNKIDETKLDKTIKVVRIINGIIGAAALVYYTVMTKKVFDNMYKTTADVKKERNLKLIRSHIETAKKNAAKYDKILNKYHPLYERAKEDEKFYSECTVDVNGDIHHDSDDEYGRKETIEIY